MKKIFFLLCLILLTPNFTEGKPLINYQYKFRLELTDQWRVKTNTQALAEAIANDNSSIFITAQPVTEQLFYSNFNTMTEKEKNDFRQNSLTNLQDMYPQALVTSAEYIQTGKNTFLLIVYNLDQEDYTSAQILHNSSCINILLTAKEINPTLENIFTDILQSFSLFYGEKCGNGKAPRMISFVK